LDDPPPLATGLAHEVWHDQLEHGERGLKYADPKLFNKAADLFINQVLRTQMKIVTLADGSTEDRPMWRCADWFLQPEQFGAPLDQTADWYYDFLSKQEEEEEGDGGQEGGDGDESQDGDGGGGDSDGDQESQGGGGGGQGQKMVGGGHCGGIAGNPSAQEIEKEIDAQYGRSEGDVRQIRKETARKVKKAIESAKGRGTLPGQFSELVKPLEDEESVTPWEVLLQNTVREVADNVISGGMDFSKRRPSKRSYLRGIIIGGLVDYELTILIVVDTSGSMDTEGQIRPAITEVCGVFEQTGVDQMWFMESDAGVQIEPRLISLEDLYEIEIHGRGGTDFRPAFTAALELDPKPDVIIYLTDGDGFAPMEEPADFATVWCIVPTPYGRRPADWGELVVLSDDQALRRPYNSAA
jgi:predicted metal-dependent peptidase